MLSRMTRPIPGRRILAALVAPAALAACVALAAPAALAAQAGPAPGARPDIRSQLVPIPPDPVPAHPASLAQARALAERLQLASLLDATLDRMETDVGAYLATLPPDPARPTAAQIRASFDVAAWRERLVAELARTTEAEVATACLAWSDPPAVREAWGVTIGGNRDSAMLSVEAWRAAGGHGRAVLAGKATWAARAAPPKRLLAGASAERVAAVRRLMLLGNHQSGEALLAQVHAELRGALTDVGVQPSTEADAFARARAESLAIEIENAFARRAGDRAEAMVRALAGPDLNRCLMLWLHGEAATSRMSERMIQDASQRLQQAISRKPR